MISLQSFLAKDLPKYVSVCNTYYHVEFPLKFFDEMVKRVFLKMINLKLIPRSIAEAFNYFIYAGVIDISHGF